MLKLKMRTKAFRDQNGRKHINPSEVGSCLRAIQFRLQNAPRRDPAYHMYRGKLVHYVIEDLVKSTNPEKREAWKRIREKQAHIPWKWQLPLNVVMPKFERSFKDFLLSNQLGKCLSSPKYSPWIEDKISVNLEDLKLPLPFPKEVLQSYTVVGLPDCMFSNLVLEFKTGVITKKNFLQGLLYEKMAQVYFKNPEIRNRIVQVRPRSVKVVMMSKFWTKDGKYRQKKEEELASELTKLITHLELWEKNPNHVMPKSISNECYKCLYYELCFNPITRLSKSISYKLRRNMRQMKKELAKILRDLNNRKRDKRVKVSDLEHMKRIRR